MATLETIAYEVSKPAIAALVKPAIGAALKSFRSLTAAAVDAFGDRFAEYVTQQAARHSCLSTIVFGHQKLLHQLYVPLTVVSSPAPGNPAQREIFIDRFQKEFIPEHQRVLITDTAGMGKSTLSKFLFLQCLKSSYAIPVFIELRHLSASSTILGMLQKQLNPSFSSQEEPKFTKRQIEKLLKGDKLIFFLDGYDEIPFKDREIVTKDIKELVEKYPENLFVITSRPETGLLAFPTFKQFTIRPLKKAESFDLIRKYDQDGELSQRLIARLSGREYDSVQEFLKNPLLTSLLYRSFEYKQNVPLKKHIFYRQVFDALFEWHDATKDGYNTREKRSGLDIDSFHRVLRVVGYISIMKGEIEGNTDAVLGWIRQAREICNSNPFSESHLLEDLVKAVPIFVKDGDYFRWSHKSLAEYFAAQYICTEGKAQQSEILGAFLTTGQISRFTNVLDQIYDIDSSAFKSNFVRPLAKEFTKYWNTSYRGLDPSIPAEEIRLRKCASFGHIVTLLGESSMELPDFKRIRDIVTSKLEPNSSKDMNYDLGNMKLMFFHHKRMSKSRTIIADTPSPFSAVLEILERKKDALITSKVALRSWSGILPSKLVNPVSVLTDDATEWYNQPDQFAATTSLLIELGPVIDAEKMLAFESNFQDDARVAALTDSLLKPMLGRKASSI